MRYFPGAARSRLVALSVAGVLTAGLLSAPFALAAGHDGHHPNRDGELKHRQGAVADRIHDAAADLDDASQEIVAATKAVQRARTRLQDARAHLGHVSVQLAHARTTATALAEDLDQSRADLATADAALAAGRQRVSDQRDVVRANALGVLTGGDPRLQTLSALTTAGSLDDISRELAADNILAGKSGQVLAELTAAEVDLAQQQDHVAAATHRVADRTRAAAAQVRTVQGLLDRARTAKADVAALVSQSVKAKQHAFDVRAHDRSVLRHLREREANIKQKILAIAAREARQAARGQQGKTGAGSGFLTYPAAGYPITSPYGYRIHPIYGYYSLHNGDDFGVPCGTQLHAAASGTIISSYYDAVWGNRMFLNLGRVNGHNMTVVYNHLSKPLSAVGEQVDRGQVIGLSGTTGWSTGCHLHFTVLVDGVAVDPMRYL